MSADAVKHIMAIVGVPLVGFWFATVYVAIGLNAEARTLNVLGRNTEEIAKVIGAKNERQVKNLLDGKTYSRIKRDS